MRAAHWNESGSLDLVDVAIGEPGAGWARLAVASCGICGSDLHGFRHPGRFPAGGQPGHELAGYAEMAGEGVQLEEGRLYAVEPIVSCGRCAPCRGGFHNRCRSRQLIGVAQPGGLAEQVLIPAERLHLLAEGFDPHMAALAEPLAVAVRAARLGDVRGKSVVIIGAGSIGLMSVVAARANGAAAVHITARHGHQAELARHLGATNVYPSVAELGPVIGDEGADVVIETVGGEADTLVDAAEIAAPGGVIVKLGVFVGNTPIPSLVFLDKELTLVASLCYADDSRRLARGEKGDFGAAVDLLAERATDLARVITHRFRLDQVDEAFRTAADKSTNSIKV